MPRRLACLLLLIGCADNAAGNGTDALGADAASPRDGAPSDASSADATTGAMPCQTQATWRPMGSLPLSDTDATAHVCRNGFEPRPDNAAANQYQPSTTEIMAFLTGETDRYGRTPAQDNPYLAYVTGQFTGTTDEIIQWTAWKWGIDEDWLRAQYVQESYWHHSTLGDLTAVASSTPYPDFSRVDATHVYQSLGISQVRWNHPDANDSGIGTEPLRWKSTAFNVDFQAATVRFYYDDPQGLRSAWGDASYAPGNQWLSIGGWFEPYPWNNAGQNDYITHVQQNLSARTWAQPGF